MSMHQNMKTRRWNKVTFRSIVAERYWISSAPLPLSSIFVRSKDGKGVEGSRKKKGPGVPRQLVFCK